MNTSSLSSLRPSLKAMRPITSYPKGKATRSSTTSKLAPLPPSTTENVSSIPTTTTYNNRTQSRSSLQLKKWRQNLFPTPSPASKREVELLGEWLNSVLAENLEQNDNPIDVCTNAQHWFSVAFNELVRQVSIDCVERGRLFAVIWKRNQDLLTKLVQIQREERQYILQCHKERILFLKTDLEYSQSRLATITTAYNSEHTRWQSSHEKEISKFTSLQQKIDEQVKGRKELLDELNELRKKLNLPDQKPELEQDEPAQSFSSAQINSFCQSLRWKMRTEKVELLDLANALDNINHYAEFQNLDTINIRQKFEKYLLSLPPDAQPDIKPIPWVISLISYILSYYMIYLSSQSLDKKLIEQPFIDFVYDILLNIYGSRIHTEQILFDFLSTIKKTIDTGVQRIFQFARFIGITNPMPLEIFHFYLYCLAMMNRAHSGPLYPEFESSDLMISGIPAQAACTAAEKIFQRFSSGRSLRFYIERLNKIASDGAMRFGGKNLAELDNVLDYIMSAYIEEYGKLDDELKDQFSKLPFKEIKTYTQFHRLLTNLKIQTDAQTIPKMFYECLKMSYSGINNDNGEIDSNKIKSGSINCEIFCKIIKKYRLNLPIQLVQQDFLNEQNSSDILKFMQMELKENIPYFEKVVEALEKVNDEIMLKQIRNSKAKFEQALSSRSLGKTFQTIQREFYEKLYMVGIFHKIE